MIIIRKPDITDIEGDVTFITKTIRDNRKYAVDGLTIDDAKITEILQISSARIATQDDKYIAFGFLSDITPKLNATLHGYIGVRDKTNYSINNAIAKNAYYLFKKNYVFDLLYQDYFKNYDIETINVFLPEYLHDKRIGQLKIKKPAAILLEHGGFKQIGILKNDSFKDKRPVDTFIYQVHRFWFKKWQKIKSEYENYNISFESLASKHRVSAEGLYKIATNKKWTRSS